MRLALVLALLAGAAPPVHYEYRVEVVEGGRELRVEARFSHVPDGCLEVGDRVELFVEAAEVRRGRRWRTLPRANRCFDAADVPRRDARIRYRVRLAEAAAAAPGRGRRGLWAQDGAYGAAPSAWLLRPSTRAAGAFRIHVETPPGLWLVSGLPRPAPNVYEGRAEFIDSTPYTVITTAPPRTLDVGGAEIEWVRLPGPLPYPEAIVERWIETSARAVSDYLGRFPVPRAAILVSPPQSGGGGSAMGYSGASIRIRAGARLAEDAGSDWMLVHEMLHLALPNLPVEHRWMEEGLSTYLEPIVRCRAGLKGARDVWRDFLSSMPHGLPAEGDDGLDHLGGLDRRRAWGGTYWGGARYWLLADVAWLQRTEGRIGLQEVLQSLVREGDIRTRWELPQLLDAAERASGAPVLRELHAQLGAAATPTDLATLWARLGVRAVDGRVELDDTAPGAWIRRRLTGPCETPDADATR